jgi:hypothetical protein
MTVHRRPALATRSEPGGADPSSQFHTDFPLGESDSGGPMSFVGRLETSQPVSCTSDPCSARWEAICERAAKGVAGWLEPMTWQRLRSRLPNRAHIGGLWTAPARPGRLPEHARRALPPSSGRARSTRARLRLPLDPPSAPRDDHERAGTSRGYPDTCRNGPPAAPSARSLRLRKNCEPVQFLDAVHHTIAQYLEHDRGDFVIRPAGGLHARHLTAVVDDADHGITEVVGSPTCSPPPRELSGGSEGESTRRPERRQRRFAAK